MDSKKIVTFLKSVGVVVVGVLVANEASKMIAKARTTAPAQA